MIFLNRDGIYGQNSIFCQNIGRKKRNKYDLDLEIYFDGEILYEWTAYERISPNVSKWTKSECQSLISMGTDLNKYWEYQNPKLSVHFLDVNPFTLDPFWSQICSIFTPFIKKLLQSETAKKKGVQKQKDSLKTKKSKTKHVS